jgi:glycolate oxidase iron-sulfur subunit
MKGVHEGTLERNRAFADEMYFCLDCQACMTACPAGVRYGELVEHAREVIHENHGEPSRIRWLKKAVLFILSSRKMILRASRLLLLYQRSGLREAVEKSNILSLISPELHQKHALLPVADARPFDLDAPGFNPGNPPVKGRVAFLSGCIMNVSFGEVHRASVRVLQKCGFDVIIPEGQGCCGSLHAHNGERSMAAGLARELIEKFERHDVDHIVVDSAGCGAFMKEYGTYLRDDPEFSERAIRFSSRVKDFSEFLVAAGPLPFVRSLPIRVTYHDACHLVHSQKVSHQPRSLIKSIPGIDFVELADSTWCCGSAGIYNVIQHEHATALRARKLAALRESDAAMVATCNPGCQLQIEAGLALSESDMRTTSLAELLDRAM